MGSFGQKLSKKSFGTTLIVWGLNNLGGLKIPSNGGRRLRQQSSQLNMILIYLNNLSLQRISITFWTASGNLQENQNLEKGSIATNLLLLLASKHKDFSIQPHSGLGFLDTVLPRTSYGVTIVQPLRGLDLSTSIALALTRLLIFYLNTQTCLAPDGST